jgi:hypothetical protein
VFAKNTHRVRLEEETGYWIGSLRFNELARSGHGEWERHWEWVYWHISAQSKRPRHT